MKFIHATWPAPKNIKALTTTRQGGYSQPPFDSFNLASHVDDELTHVMQNRSSLKKQLLLPSEPLWLNQQHTAEVTDANHFDENADGIYCNCSNLVCAILTADCLPLLLCNRAGTEIAALHGGWRGLANGIIERGLDKFACDQSDILVWLGPAISTENFEVGEEVYDGFIQKHVQYQTAFHATHHAKKYLADTREIAKQTLMLAGIEKNHIFQCQHTTDDLKNFYSYRHQNTTGRVANLIWIYAQQDA